MTPFQHFQVKKEWLFSLENDDMESSKHCVQLFSLVFIIRCLTKLSGYGYHQRENTGSRLFTEVKPCWTGLISGWVTISIKIPCAVLLGKSGWHSGHQSRLPTMLYVDRVSVDLNLTSRVFSGHSGFLPPQNWLLL